MANLWVGPDRVIIKKNLFFIEKVRDRDFLARNVPTSTKLSTLAEMLPADDVFLNEAFDNLETHFNELLQESK